MVRKSSDDSSLSDITFDDSGTATGIDDGGDDDDDGGSDAPSELTGPGGSAGTGGTYQPEDDETTDDSGGGTGAPEDDNDDGGDASRDTQLEQETGTSTEDVESGEAAAPPTDEEDLTTAPEQDFGRSDDETSGFEDPDRVDLDELRFAGEETTVAGETYREGEALPTDRDVARRLERQAVEDSDVLSREDVAVTREDGRLQTDLTAEGEAQVERQREFRQRQRERQLTAAGAGLAGRVSARQRSGQPGPGGVVTNPQELERGEDFRVVDGQLGLTRDFATQRIEEQFESRYGEDLQRGEDFTVEETDRGLVGRPTESFLSERRAARRERAVADLERQLEQQYGAELDRGDISIRYAGRDPTGRYTLSDDADAAGDTQVYATLSQEGERTVAVQNAPLRDAPVIGALTTTGARYRQNELQATDPYAEAFREETPSQTDVGQTATNIVPGAETVANVGGQGETVIDESLATPRQYSQSRLDDLRNATLDATPYAESPADQRTGTDAATGAAAVGVTGTATGTGVGTGVGTGTATGAAAVGAPAAALFGLATVGAGYQRGDVDRAVRRETVSQPGDDPAVQQAQFGELGVPDQSPTEQREVSVPEGEQFSGELGTPEGEPGEGDELPTREGGAFPDEIEPGDPTPTGEVQIPEQTPSDDGQPQQPGQDETTVPSDYPLPGRDMPADPGRDYVSGERGDGFVAGTEQAFAGGMSQEEEEELTELLGEEQVEELSRRERREVARQIQEQTLYEQEEEYGDIVREQLWERAEEGTFDPASTNPDIDAGDSGQAQDVFEQNVEDLTPYQRRLIRGRMGSDARERIEEAQTPSVYRDSGYIRGEEDLAGFYSPSDAYDAGLAEGLEDVGLEGAERGAEKGDTFEDIRERGDADTRGRQDVGPDEEAAERGDARQRGRQQADEVAATVPNVGNQQDTTKRTQQQQEHGTQTQQRQQFENPNEPRYGRPTAFPVGYPVGFGVGQTTRRPRRPDDGGDEPDAPSDTGSGGLSAGGEGSIGAGWYSEYLTATALGPSADRGSPTASALEDRPESEAYTSTLPTQAQVSGTEEEQEAIEETYAALTFGAAGDGDDDQNQGNLFNLSF